jgi:hypothetical protein
MRCTRPSVWCHHVARARGSADYELALRSAKPVPPVAMGKSTRGVELESVEDLDERQIAAWMKQFAAVAGVGGKKR